MQGPRTPPSVVRLSPARQPTTPITAMDKLPYDDDIPTTIAGDINVHVLEPRNVDEERILEAFNAFSARMLTVPLPVGGGPYQTRDRRRVSD